MRPLLLGGGVAALALWLVRIAGGDWVPFGTTHNWVYFALGLGLLGLARL
jgi:hypothetical protein